VHVVVDDASRLAYVEILPDEKRQSVTGFLVRALLRLRHIRTPPYTPKTNGKAERFIQTCSASGPTRCRTAAPIPLRRRRGGPARTIDSHVVLVTYVQILRI
jgi:transposase InsO family protein